MKPFILIYSPFETMSGYGAHARDLIQPLLEKNKKENKYEIKLISAGWGVTPKTYLNNESKKIQELYKPHITTIQEFQGAGRKPDLGITISIPNEFMIVGVKNLAITAGVEVDKCSELWTGILDQNRDYLHHVITPSKFTHDVLFKDVKYFNKKNSSVLFEGVNTDIFHPIDFKDEVTSVRISEIDEKIKEPFSFLYMGQWVNLNNYMDADGRKNVKDLIKYFLKTFIGMKHEVSLVMKTNAGNNSYIDREKIIDMVKNIKLYTANELKVNVSELPNIHIIHGHLSDTEVNHLYNLKQIKAMVSTTKGEGYGRPLAEFASIGKPVLATGWSGHLDFLTNKDFLFDYELKEVEEFNRWKDVIVDDAKWAIVKENDVINKLSNVYFDYETALKEFQPISTNIRENLNLTKMQDIFVKKVESMINVMDVDLDTLNKKLKDMKLKRIK